jgi:hypothetical protein
MVPLGGVPTSEIHLEVSWTGLYEIGALWFNTDATAGIRPGGG